jgi:transcriptional regulator with XRE-family HTH domain
MLPPDNQRRLLGAFLRRRRELLSAPDVGLHAIRAGRKRTPGLRREEMAQLSGMSPTWYAWIEQGRDISVSPDALARLADAMRLTPAERSYLFQLTRKRDPAEQPNDEADEGAPSAILRETLNSLTAPAYLLDRLWRARAWNKPAVELFADWLGGPELCLLDYVFLNAAARAFIVDWEIAPGVLRPNCAPTPDAIRTIRDCAPWSIVCGPVAEISRGSGAITRSSGVKAASGASTTRERDCGVTSKRRFRRQGARTTNWSSCSLRLPQSRSRGESRRSDKSGQLYKACRLPIG